MLAMVTLAYLALIPLGVSQPIGAARPLRRIRE